MLVFFIAQSILVPLKGLMVGIDKATKGDLTWQVAVRKHARDEIAQVSEAFNIMIGNLKNVTASRDELDKEIRERKRIEETMRNTLADLQKTHEELKQTQNQLLQSEKLASIGQLAAGIAHEINNPVGFISSNLQTLEQYIGSYSQLLVLTEKLKKCVEDKNMERAALSIEELAKLEEEINLDFIIGDIDNLLRESKVGIERIRKIVLDLRTFARTDQEVMEQTKVETIIDSILSIIANELKYKVDLKKDYADVPMIRCNPQKLGQVFVNLLVNAAQAIKDRGIIEIKTYQKDRFIYVDISDNGDGIAEENLKKIFDAFFTTKPVGKGTGLGLSISYEIVKKHGGDIMVKSEIGKGTTFTVMLPVGETDTPQKGTGE